MRIRIEVHGGGSGRGAAVMRERLDALFRSKPYANSILITYSWDHTYLLGKGEGHDFQEQFCRIVYEDGGVPTTILNEVKVVLCAIFTTIEDSPYRGARKKRRTKGK